MQKNKGSQKWVSGATRQYQKWAEVPKIPKFTGCWVKLNSLHRDICSTGYWLQSVCSQPVYMFKVRFAMNRTFFDKYNVRVSPPVSAYNSATQGWKALSVHLLDCLGVTLPTSSSLLAGIAGQKPPSIFKVERFCFPGPNLQCKSYTATKLHLPPPPRLPPLGRWVGGCQMSGCRITPINPDSRTPFGSMVTMMVMIMMMVMLNWNWKKERLVWSARGLYSVIETQPNAYDLIIREWKGSQWQYCFYQLPWSCIYWQCYHCNNVWVVREDYQAVITPILSLGAVPTCTNIFQCCSLQYVS